MKLIREGKLVEYRYVERYNSISPALLLYFDTDKGLTVRPVRQHRWPEYVELIEEYFNE